MATHNDTGNWGETKACEFLQSKGFEILKKNYRYKHTEVDLIAKKNKLLIFIEVKTRSGTGFGMPEEFVTRTKAKLVMYAAEHYIFEKNWLFDVRFDILSIVILPDKSFKINHIEDAFY